ncbi:MAG TPA: PAS domain S-box protein, partial [Kofleriaceae bacterium]
MTPRSGEPMLPEIVKDELSRIKILLDTLFEAADDAIFLMNGERFADCNPSTLHMFGCKAKTDILGETPVRFSPDRQPDGASSAEKSRDLITAALTGVPQHFEWRHYRLDLTPFDVEVSLNRCFVGGAPFLLAVVRDITARKRAEVALLHEKQFSDALIDSLPGPFYLYDPELRLHRWNKFHEMQMGYAAEELQGKPIAALTATEAHRERVLAAAHRLMQPGDEIEFLETEILHKDGSVVPYLVSGARVDSPDGPMVLGVGLNLTPLVQAKKALAASERNYRELFNATHDGIFIHDETGRVLDVNERGCAMFGLDASEARRSLLVEL